MSHSKSVRTSAGGTGTTHLPGLTMLRFVAVLLITNSHLDTLYPIPLLATGGSLGNALFFGLSGYGLALSTRRYRHFFGWLARRLGRIYPATLLVTLGVIVVRRPDWVGSATTAFKTLVYPTPYWFIAALLAYYVLAYPVLRSRAAWLAVAALLVTIAPYAWLYTSFLDTSVWSIEGPGMLKYVFYWQTMMLGIAMAFSRHRRKTATWVVAFALFLVLLAYGGLKIALLYGYVPYLWQFGVHALTLIGLGLALWLGESWQPMAAPLRSAAGPAIATIAGLTLEIYLVQYRVYSSALVAALVFPANVIVFAIGTFAIAWVVHRLAGVIERAFRFGGREYS